ncbi:MAG TPA: NifB/NifX family molybdenum-iron cluster-binding protein [Bacteroidales bacterium]|nr:NifB/NifX family molybdenum-iron cluster-binding protein [Bacteroidales bacterium]
MKRIAIPEEDGMLFEHFGHTRQFAVYSASTDLIESEEVLVAPPHEPGRLPLFLSEQGITDVIAGGIGDRAIALLQSIDIQVTAGVAVRPVRELAQDYLHGDLAGGRNRCDH